VNAERQAEKRSAEISKIPMQIAFEWAVSGPIVACNSRYTGTTRRRRIIKMMIIPTKRSMRSRV
jgi:hypothetical protein